MKTFTIIEKKWARGNKGGPSKLLNSSGNKCCLGFLCLQAGARKVSNCYYPHDMKDVGKVLPELATPGGKQLSMDIARINDDTDLTDASRKRKLQPYFAKIGWKPVYK